MLFILLKVSHENFILKLYFLFIYFKIILDYLANNKLLKSDKTAILYAHNFLKSKAMFPIQIQPQIHK